MTLDSERRCSSQIAVSGLATALLIGWSGWLLWLLREQRRNGHRVYRLQVAILQDDIAGAVAQCSSATSFN